MPTVLLHSVDVDRLDPPEEFSTRPSSPDLFCIRLLLHIKQAFPSSLQGFSGRDATKSLRRCMPSIAPHLRQLDERNDTPGTIPSRAHIARILAALPTVHAIQALGHFRRWRKLGCRSGDGSAAAAAEMCVAHMHLRLASPRSGDGGDEGGERVPLAESQTDSDGALGIMRADDLGEAERHYLRCHAKKQETRGMIRLAHHPPTVQDASDALSPLDERAVKSNRHIDALATALLAAFSKPTTLLFAFDRPWYVVVLASPEP